MSDTPSKDTPVDQAFKTFVTELNYTAKEISKTSQRVSTNILDAFLAANYNVDRTDKANSIYTPKMYDFGIKGARVVSVARAALTNNTNLVPCTLELNYKPASATYEMDTKICFESTSSKYIDKLVASTLFDDTTRRGFPADNSVSHRTL